ncbi:hypothetical protein [Sphingomonas lycopersici]|uniref:Uncharacterized protein n=1 Tax=Sphingomonas lycopersici TaxID=2951807 RepID=A0AA41ZB17_9SPHN|nr:hypothetical protein [Sphingomonas lycopersici]MCW6533604.1 hypothetical protein [Sphingomonas lycopersici]
MPRKLIANRQRPAHKDGVSEPAGAGESTGGAYPNPHQDHPTGRFAGGQSDKKYEGPPNPNATTRSAHIKA